MRAIGKLWFGSLQPTLSAFHIQSHRLSQGPSLGTTCRIAWFCHGFPPSPPEITLPPHHRGVAWTALECQVLPSTSNPCFWVILIACLPLVPKNEEHTQKRLGKNRVGDGGNLWAPLKFFVLFFSVNKSQNPPLAWHGQYDASQSLRNLSQSQEF